MWVRTLLKSEKARRLALVLSSLAFTLCLLEIPALLRILDYQHVFWKSAWRHTVVADPELLVHHPPDSHFSGARRGGELALQYEIPAGDETLYRWDLSYDHNGFRNDRDLKTADIVVIGDSFVEGMTVPYAGIVTSLLAALQRKVVANLGQGSYGPQQELIVLRRYGLPLGPRTVIWMFFEGNDLQDAVNYRQTMTQRAIGPWRGFKARSFTWNAFLKLQRTLTPKVPGAQRAGLFRTADGTAVTVYFGFRPQRLTGRNPEGLEETTAALAEAGRLCKAQGSRLVVVFIPTAFRAVHRFCQFRPESECRNWVVNDMPARLQRAVASISSEIGYLDLTPSFEAAAKSGLLPYYRDDSHWSEEGHRIAAEALHEYLSATQSR